MALIQQFKTSIDFFKSQSEFLEIIVETGWPTEGKSINGVEGSVSNMKRFWCTINEWSKQNSVKVDFFTAFDEPYKESITGEAHYGWWVRTGNETSNPSDFREKITQRPSHNSHGATVGLSIAGGLGFIALLSVIGFLYFKLRIVKNQLLTKQDIDEFKKGCIGYGSNGELTEDAVRLPYDRSYEIPKSKCHIDEHRLLGKGAFGFVYKGKLDGKDNDVAFKITQPNCASSSMKSLLSEIKIMIHVGQHPNVVCIIGAFTGEIQRGYILIATELCENGSLESYLKSMKETLSNQAYESEELHRAYVNVPTAKNTELDDNVQLLNKLFHWSCGIANGMEYIASKNVIHADLAARNILLTGDETVKITDFGLSRRLYEYTNYVKQNQEPMPWRWMAIESLEQMHFSTKSDVWSYGVTLYEILSLGNIPYPGLSWNQSFVRDLRNGLRLDKPRFASDPMYMLMKTCWTINPQERPTFTTLKTSFDELQNLYSPLS